MYFFLSEEHLAVQEAAKEFANTHLLNGVIERDEKQKLPTFEVKN